MGVIRARVLSNVAQIKALANQHKAIEIRLFGSVAQGEDRENSDIDFLVEFERGASILDQVHLEIALRQLLECPVEVVPLGGLKARDAHVIETAVTL